MPDLPRPRERAMKAGWHVLMPVLVAMCVVGVAYAPVLSAQALSFDDNEFLTANPLVRSPSWNSAARFFGEILEPSTVSGYYIPLTMVSLMLDVAAGGEPDDLRPLHRTQLALHVLNIALLVLLLHGLFRHAWSAAGVALAYGLHPLMVEPIAWIAERKTLLATFFVLLALLAYLRWVRARRARWITASLAMFLLALLSKPTSLPLPILLLVLDFWPLRRLSRRALVEKVPFLALAALFAAITVISHARTTGAGVHAQRSVGEAALIASYALTFYLQKIAWPGVLSSVYPMPQLTWAAPETAMRGIALVLIIAAALFAVRRTRAPLAGLAFFVVALAPTLGLVEYGWVLVSDKYAYLPLVGLTLPFAALAGRFAGMPRGWRIAAGAALILLLAVEAGASRAYLTKWRDSETLLRHMVAVTPDDPMPHVKLGSLLHAKGDLPGAVQSLRRAVGLNPRLAEAHNNLGVALGRAGELAAAAEHLRTAIQLKPDYATAHQNLGMAYAASGQVEAALYELRESIRLDPELRSARLRLADLLARRGRRDEARAELRALIERSPGTPEADRAGQVMRDLEGTSAVP